MDKKNLGTLMVSALCNGTVIDHIPSDVLFKVINILKLQQIDTMITFGSNLESKTHGKKAIIKIADHYFAAEDINRIALVAPSAKLNIIKNFEVSEKQKVTLPEEIKGIAKCMNPQCVTNNENITTLFKIASKNPIELRCHYCEKITDDNNIVII